MFILSQDKKKMREYREIVVQRGNKKQKPYIILGKYFGILEDNYVLGEYETEELAITELNNIYNAIHHGERAYSVN